MTDELKTPAGLGPVEHTVRPAAEAPTLVERLRERAGQYDEYAWHTDIELEAADQIERLSARLGAAADKALAYAASYEMAVARLVLAMDYMHPEQRQAFNAAWVEKRAELRGALGA